MKKVLITGATGQIGTELTFLLRDNYGKNNVIAAGHKTMPGKEFIDSGPFHRIDCNDINSIVTIIKKYKINTIYHLAAILSAKAEQNPQLAWKVNMDGLYNILEAAREFDCSVFIPSSIGAFGLTTPQDNTPQDTIQRPNTIYGITKVAGELLCDYYFAKYNVDTRGVRYPGIISYKTEPGGGTTDYAVDIYFNALKNKNYTCYLKEDTQLDLMYMPDALKAAVSLMEADPAKLKHRNAFNVTSMSLTPNDITNEIKKIIPEFRINYKIDPVRQKIADSWPNHMDDSTAREEWEWHPDFDLEKMTADMIDNILKLNKH